MAFERDNFWLDGEDAKTYGIVLQKEIEFSEAEPVTESVKIAGKDGEMVYYDGSYKNVKGVAKCYVLGEEAAFMLTNVNAWLLSKTGYRRLQTLHEPHFYRLARVVRGAKLDHRLNMLNGFNVEFDCNPYKYFLSGEEAIAISESATIESPTPFTSLPLIVTHGSGSGTLTVNGNAFLMTDCNETVIDSEKRKAYRGTTNMNSTVSGIFPTLGKTNTISFTGGITSITLTPRWRSI